MSDRPIRSTPRNPRKPPRTQRALDPRVEAHLVAFEDAGTREERARIGTRLATSGARDPRIRAALVRMLEDDPLNASANLSAFGDRTAVRDLAQAADRILAAPAHCGLCLAENLTAIVTAVRCLGGALADEQLAAIDVALDRAFMELTPLENHQPPPDDRHEPSESSGSSGPGGPLDTLH